MGREALAPRGRGCACPPPSPRPEPSSLPLRRGGIAASSTRERPELFTRKLRPPTAAAARRACRRGGRATRDDPVARTGNNFCARLGVRPSATPALRPSQPGGTVGAHASALRSPELPPLRRLAKTFQTGRARRRSNSRALARRPPKILPVNLKSALLASASASVVSRAPCRKVLSSGSVDRQAQYKRARGEKASRSGG